MTHAGIDIMRLRRLRRVLEDVRRLGRIAHGPAEVVELLARLDAQPEELKQVIQDPDVLMVALDVVAREILPHLDAAEHCVREREISENDDGGALRRRAAGS